MHAVRIHKRRREFKRLASRSTRLRRRCRSTSAPSPASTPRRSSSPAIRCGRSTSPRPTSTTPSQRNAERGLLGYTGTLQGQAGLGAGHRHGLPGGDDRLRGARSSSAARKLIRVGTCGGLQVEPPARRPDRRAERGAGRLDRDPPRRRRAALPDGVVVARPRGRAPRQAARPAAPRRPDRLERPLLQPRRGPVRALGRRAACSRSRWRPPRSSRVAALRGVDAGLPADGERHRRRGRVHAHLRRGAARGRRPDDDARARRRGRRVSRGRAAAARRSRGEPPDRLPRQPGERQRRDRAALADAPARAPRALGLDGEALLSERPGQLERARRRRPPARGRCSSSSAATGRSTRSSTASPGRRPRSRSSRPGRDATSGAPTASRTASTTPCASRSTGDTRRSTSDGPSSAAPTAASATRLFANAALGRDERRGRAPRERDVEAPRRPGDLLLGARASSSSRWTNTEMTRRASRAASGAGRCTTSIVANGRFLGGGMKLAPDARPDDGLFDVVLVGDVSKLDFVTTSPKLYRGGHVGHPRIEIVRSPWVSDRRRRRRCSLELDGEQDGTTPVRFEIVPGALRLRVPRARRPSWPCRRAAGSASSRAVARPPLARPLRPSPSRARSAASRSRVSRSSIESSVWSSRSPRSLTCIAPWTALRVAGLCASFPSAPSPTDWSCEITVLRTI